MTKHPASNPSYWQGKRRMQVEDSGDFFDWHYFQWVTVSEDW